MPRHQPITEGSKQCCQCKIPKQATDFYTIFRRNRTELFSRCKVCSSKNGKNRRASRDKNTNYHLDKEYHFKHQYGISTAEYHQMVKDQDCRCACCGKVSSNLVVDHCHNTKTVRGLLCSPCNVGIGMFGEDLEKLQKAIDYLKHTLQQNKSAES